MNKGKGFFPDEIIFSVTDSCNLKCPHCYVSRRAKSLDAEKCIKFLETCPPALGKIGFTGGEPFLALEFIEKLVKYAVSKDMLFDRIMTNGIWWENQEKLEEKLKILYDAGFDGKICLSFDSFHNQPLEKIIMFCKKVLETFGPDSLEIQTVLQPSKKFKREQDNDIQNLIKLSEALNCSAIFCLNKKGIGQIIMEGNEEFFKEKPELSPYVTVYTFLPSLPSSNPESWKAKKWFKEDFCQGPGQILYFHADGNIAPCCGFSNENKELFTGSIDQSYNEVFDQSKENPMIRICYEDGLSSLIKKFKKRGIKLPGKTDDICTFCDFVAKNMNIFE